MNYVMKRHHTYSHLIRREKKVSLKKGTYLGSLNMALVILKFLSPS